MRFRSTRGGGEALGLREVIFQGLAPDGGLYYPTSMPDLKDLFVALGHSPTMAEIGEAVIDRLFSDELPNEAAGLVAKRGFTFEPVLSRLTPRVSILELFHGPSAAFKDFGACFLAALMEVLLGPDQRRAVILTATSGDTGSAVAEAFHGRAGIDVVILYPSGRVSPLQEKQLTTHGGNVHALEVAGSFDDCQRMVKDAFLDADLKRRMTLTSANSINLGRLLPQVFYYVWAAARVAGSPVFCVPSGNFGNLTAGLYAWAWGLSTTRFIAATNANHVVPDYLESGLYSPRPSVATLSNAMDVGSPSNFERFLAVFDHDLERARRVVRGDWVTDEDTRETMARHRAGSGVFLDPHTAVGVRASERYAQQCSDHGCPIVVVGTAHPGKFVEVVEAATGEPPPLPECLRRLADRPKLARPIGDRHEDLKRFLLDHFRA